MIVNLQMTDRDEIIVTRAQGQMMGGSGKPIVLAIVPPRGWFLGYRYRRLRRMMQEDGRGPHELKEPQETKR